jgi:allantoicase
MKPEIAKFIDRIDRLEKRYKGDLIARYADTWLVPKEELIAVRDHLTKPGLFDREGSKSPL